MSSLSVYSGVLVTVLLVSLAYFSARSRRNGRSVPGPKPSWIPYVGNLKEFSALEDPDLLYEYMHEVQPTYGDVVQVSILGQNLVYLNSLKAATDLMTREKYCERPQFVVAGDIMGAYHSTVLAPYGPYWKSHRRIFRETIGDKDLFQEFASVTEDEVRELIARLLKMEDTPSEPKAFKEIHLTVAKWTVRVAYGMRVNSLDNEFIRETEATGQAVTLAFQPGTYFADLLPILKHVPSWFPGAGWKRYARKIGDQVERIMSEPYEQVKQALATGETIPRSLVSVMIQKEITDDFAQRYCAGSLYAAGLRTNVDTLHTFISIMILFPETQARAQAELDAVVGTDRLPRIDDKKDLPYIDALIQECCRFQAIAPQGVPRRVAEDDEYRGMTIRKNSFVFTNVYAIVKDPSMYPEPEKFMPERFLVPNPPVDPRSYSFGLGRRICPGKPLAENLLFLTFASLLATFKFARPLDDDGKEYVPKHLYGSSFNSPLGVKPFPMRMIPRSGRSVDATSLEQSVLCL